MSPNPTIISWNATECAVTHSVTMSVVCITKNDLFSLANLVENILYCFLGGVIITLGKKLREKYSMKGDLIGENIKVLAHFSQICPQVEYRWT